MVDELLTAGLAVLVAVVGYTLNRKTKQIHVLVNSRMAAVVARVEQLEKLIRATPGIEVPADPVDPKH